MKRNALIIGASNYEHCAKLHHTVNDAEDLSSTLRKFDFKVMELLDSTRDELLDSIVYFMKVVEEERGTALIYFSGHGIQYEGNNYLIPVDANIDAEYKLEFSAIKLDWIIHLLDKTKSQVNIIILDACRNNPFPISQYKSFSGGLIPTTAPEGTLIAFATEPNAVALEGSKENRNSIYTEAFIESLSNPELNIESLFKNVRKLVIARTKKKQIPWEHSSLVNEFYFHPKIKSEDLRQNEVADNASSETTKPVLPEAIKENSDKNKKTKWMFVLISICLTLGGFYFFMNYFVLKENRVKQVLSPLKQEVNSIGMKFVLIPEGSFRMGCSETDKDCNESFEKPAHNVSITQPLLMGVNEVTEKEWAFVLKKSVSNSAYENLPISNISWLEVQAFIERLNKIDAKYNYRLPTESEWEYAARANHTSIYYWGDSMNKDFAWYLENSKGKLSKIGQKAPNAFGLYDMLGNVSELCQDEFLSDEYKIRTSRNIEIKNPLRSTDKSLNKVLRGGSFLSNKESLRLSHREPISIKQREIGVGFRLVAWYK
jgi:formylglycine-generating enzyme required for sulfatase activity